VAPVRAGRVREHRVLHSLAFYANLRNALSSQDIVSRRPYGARPNAPRWLQLGAELEF
jgi:Fe(3+) dicitrate transport protein